MTERKKIWILLVLDTITQPHDPNPLPLSPFFDPKGPTFTAVNRGPLGKGPLDEDKINLSMSIFIHSFGVR